MWAVMEQRHFINRTASEAIITGKTGLKGVYRHVPFPLARPLMDQFLSYLYESERSTRDIQQ